MRSSRHNLWCSRAFELTLTGSRPYLNQSGLSYFGEAGIYGMIYSEAGPFAPKFSGSCSTATQTAPSACSGTSTFGPAFLEDIRSDLVNGHFAEFVFMGVISYIGSNTSGYPLQLPIQPEFGAAPRRSAASLLVSLSSPHIVPGKSVPVGKTGRVTVSVEAVGGTVHAISLGKGLVPSSGAAVVVGSPPGLSGFTLDRGVSRQFLFQVKTAFAGKVTLTVNADGKTISGAAVHGSGELVATIGQSGLAVDWSMPDRLRAANSAWPGDTGLPPASFVDPKDWTVSLFLTNGSQKTCPAGDTFDWSVSGSGFSSTAGSHGCAVDVQVPKLGVYSVTARELKNGVPTGAEATNKNVVVRDWLIVGLGDSNGSGQGNPPYTLDARCDRSVTSYQYQTAQYIENHDPHTSVTFLFDACSGARSDQVWLNSYEGQEPSGGVMLPSQLDQVKGVLGTRKPDAMIMSVGINDLFFGPIMSFCATYNTTGTTFTNRTCESSPVTQTKDALGYTTEYSQSSDLADQTIAARTATRLSVLPNRLSLLNQHLASLHAAHVFATQYPDETTNQNGQLCNNTGPFPKLSSTVWGWLQHVGKALNGIVAATSSLGWIPVTGIPARFIGHGYCSTASYFFTPVASLWAQGNTSGGFHATAGGAAITRELTREQVCQALYGNPGCDGEVPAPN